jgi:anti-sigma B factor antagonist
MNDPALVGDEPDQPLRIAIEQARPDVVVVRLIGDLDLLTATRFRERLRPLLDQPGQTVLVELSGLSFLGSAGLAELAAAHDTATKIGARIVLVANARAVLRPLEVTGLHTLFPIFESVEAAWREPEKTVGAERGCKCGTRQGMGQGIRPCGPRGACGSQPRDAC